MKSLGVFVLTLVAGVILGFGIVGYTKSVEAQIPEKLDIYACESTVAGGSPMYDTTAKTCILFERQSKRKYIISILDGKNGGGVTIVPVN